jgi:hypothetical protein
MTTTKTTYAPPREWHRGVQASAGTHGGRDVIDLGRITGAGRRLASWLQGLGPRRQMLGLAPATPAPYRPNARALARARKARRHTVQASRRANR